MLTTTAMEDLNSGNTQNMVAFEHEMLQLLWFPSGSHREHLQHFVNTEVLVCPCLHLFSIATLRAQDLLNFNRNSRGCLEALPVISKSQLALCCTQNILDM